MIVIETDEALPLPKACEKAAAIIRSLETECLLRHGNLEIIVRTNHAKQIEAHINCAKLLGVTP